MTSRVWALGLLLFAGCVEGPPSNFLVPEHAPGVFAWDSLPRTPTLPPGTEETARRVAAIGQQVVLANPQIGLRPRFATFGAPQAEIFHRGGREIWISEGLANRCTTDAELAAVLSYELGRMVAERAALSTPAQRWREQPPPPDLRVGNRNESYFDATEANQAYELELAQYEIDRRRAQVQGLPSPESLARLYLRRAGYPETAFTEAGPLLQAAETNGAVERQLRNQPAPAGATLGAPVAP
jgi:predicted Zn-dependent protease